MRLLATLSAAALAAVSFTAPAKAFDYSTCVDKWGNTNCAAMIHSVASCAFATNPRIAHWSAERRVDKAIEVVEQKWDEAGVNFARIDDNVMKRLASEFTMDYYQKSADKTFPNRNLY